uniref:Uncharacterized protein n=1 Tax=Anopheles quadriannulatus TaxID=34691 RepID=A0A182XT16_ANOQN
MSKKKKGKQSRKSTIYISNINHTLYINHEKTRNNVFDEYRLKQTKSMVLLLAGNMQQCNLVLPVSLCGPESRGAVQKRARRHSFRYDA